METDYTRMAQSLEKLGASIRSETGKFIVVLDKVHFTFNAQGELYNIRVRNGKEDAFWTAPAPTPATVA